MSKDKLQQRATMNATIRTFFQQRNVLEVETPALSQAANTDPAIESFALTSTTQTRYLHTSAEYPMKRLLAQDSGDIYQICKVWRENENGQHHNPEFTMLEYYRLDFSYQQLMQEVATLLLSLFKATHLSVKYSTYEQLFLEILHINPHTSGQSVLKTCIKKQDLDVVGTLNKSAMLDLLMTHCIEPTFKKNRLTFVYDYPATQCALAKLKQCNEKKYQIAQRFEVYFGNLELGNGYQEETDAVKNANTLKNELATRKKRQQKIVPIDHSFLHAMQQGIPKCAGVAIGLDRVLMCIMKTPHIKDVLSFSWQQA